jgi:AraC-like DNA-binding protein
MKKPVTIAVVMEKWGEEEANSIIEGAMLYINEHPDLRLVEVPVNSGKVPATINWDEIDGVLAWVGHRNSWLLEMKKPKVNCSGDFAIDQIPAVTYDNQEIVRTVLTQAVRLNVQEVVSLRNAGAGRHHQEWDARLSDELKSLGISYRTHDHDNPEHSPDLAHARMRFPDPAEEIKLLQLLNAVRKPSLIWAEYGLVGDMVCKMIRHLGFSIPEEMAVLANNDTRAARFAHPPLSVIPMPGQLMGLEAMKLLDFMIRHGDVARREVQLRLPPVVLRASTDRHSGSLDISEAGEMIRLYACQGLTVTELAELMNMNRVKLNRLFKKQFGKPPVKAIHEERLSRIHHWLCDTDLAMARIAKLNGFANIFHFYRFFKRLTKMTPTEYRLKHCQQLG